MEPSPCTPPCQELSKETKECDLKHPRSVDLISTNKTNKQPSFIDRLVWHVALAQALPHPQLIFPSKTWFFGIYLNFQQKKSLKNQYLPHSESKSYQINFIKSCSSSAFQQHQRHIPIPLKISATI
jgi:hypothetical protein